MLQSPNEAFAMLQSPLLLPPPLLLLLNLLDVDGDEALGEAPKARHRVG